MTDTTTSESVVNNKAVMSADGRTHAIICYSLMLLACLLGFTSIIAVVWAYIKRGSTGDPIADQHLSNVITVFWVSLILSIVGALTWFFFIGGFIILITAIWVIYRMVKGLIRVLDCKPFNDSIA